MKDPIFFISSTIYDFKDLRSSLKFYLEKQGCRVIASEFNDFPKSLEQHSYEACLETIKSADYFILLIGSRVGGWYDEINQISITQKEYKVAYEMHKKGTLKIINFVRSEVWQAKDDRENFLREIYKLDLTIEKQERIERINSKYIENYNHIKTFLKEIGLNEETKKSIKGEGTPPTGNWIHQFTSFKDIIDVIDNELFHSIPLKEIAARSLLKSELESILKQSLIKLKETIVPPKYAINEFHQNVKIDTGTFGNDILLSSKTAVPKEIWSRICFYAIHLLNVNIKMVIIPKLIMDDVFLKFDNKENIFVETNMYKYIFKLHQEIIALCEKNDMKDNLKIIFNDQLGNSQSSQVFVPNLDLVQLIFAMQKWSNIIDIAESLLVGLKTGKLLKLDLFTHSPIPSEQDKLEKEKISNTEINEYITTKYKISE